jgi:hypothetical protein
MTGNDFNKIFVLSVWFVVLTSSYHFVRAQGMFHGLLLHVTQLLVSYGIFF